MNTTEKTYLHIIQELENKDVDLVMRSLSFVIYVVSAVLFTVTAFIKDK